VLVFSITLTTTVKNSPLRGPSINAQIAYIIPIRCIQYTQTHISTEAYATLTVAAADRIDRSVEYGNLNQLRLVQYNSSSLARRRSEQAPANGCAAS
jgi:hypothetical protein